MWRRSVVLCRIRNRMPREKLIIIAESIVNSVLRYGIAVYINPVYETEDLKERKLPGNTRELQTLQNNMIRVVLGYKRSQHINMERTRTKINMMSVNQMAIYHTLLEAFNVVRKTSSEQIKDKWQQTNGGRYSLRRMDANDLKVPEKPKVRCTGFSYNGSKLWNYLPDHIRKTTLRNVFKDIF